MLIPKMNSKHFLKTNHNRATISSKLEKDNQYLHVHMVSAQVDEVSLPW